MRGGSKVVEVARKEVRAAVNAWLNYNKHCDFQAASWYCSIVQEVRQSPRHVIRRDLNLYLYPFV